MTLFVTVFICHHWKQWKKWQCGRFARAAASNQLKQSHCWLITLYVQNKKQPLNA